MPFFESVKLMCQENVFKEFSKIARNFETPRLPKVSEMTLLIHPTTLLHDLVTKSYRWWSTTSSFLLKKWQHIFSSLFCHFFLILLTFGSPNEIMQLWVCTSTSKKGLFLNNPAKFQKSQTKQRPSALN